MRTDEPLAPIGPAAAATDQQIGRRYPPSIPYARVGRRRTTRRRSDTITLPVVVPVGMLAGERPVVLDELLDGRVVGGG